MDDDAASEGAVPLEELEATLRRGGFSRGVRRQMMSDARAFARFCEEGGADRVRFRAFWCTDCGRPQMEMFGSDPRDTRRMH